ncbi:YqiA/YcfP family alpha/beta fold hydrolase [Pseudomonas sp. RIT-PI-S]|uniref:YqiA/YcfP family alpha/beta fold hydrolase n=1 Tax=Pseudomonas sp. RIT-PI-S TaxID=3035295 RepID=UPI0021DA992B|nr:YqiA/YcfP family alpha/beta fold hydrolase [Pseudomonas sp. RIT-PI-S]
MTASILYIHGLNSSPDSRKAMQLVNAAAQLGLAGQLRIPALHHHPREAMAQLEEAIVTLGEPLLVGSSLGGYYATHLAQRHGLRAVLINPAVNPHRLFDGHLGVQRNLYTQEEWQLTEGHVQALADLEVAPPQAGERIQVWLQTADETLDYRHAEAFYQGCRVEVRQGGDHSYQGFAERIPELLKLAGVAPARCALIDLGAL